MAGLPPILIVDDDPDDLFFLRRLLAKSDLSNKVVAFEDPIGAIDYLQLESGNPNPLFIPCVILTDLNMPDRNGLEFTRWVRAHPRLKDIRIVMITDSQDPQDQVRAKEAGVSEFLQKFPTAKKLRSVLGNLPCFGSSK